jgi:multiple sugar transport system permease protein
MLTEGKLDTPLLPIAVPPIGVAPRRRRRVVGRRIGVLVLTAVALFFTLPVVWLLLAPTKTHSNLISEMPLAFGSFAQLGKTWHNLVAYENGVILLWLRNSAIYTLGGTLIAVGVSVPAGYGLAVTQFLGRKVLLSITLVVMLVPANALVLPMFLGFSDLHMVGNVFSVILPFAFFPFGVYLVYIYFSTAVPEELLAASRVDGCTEWKTFRYIAAPLSKPVIGLVFFFSFVANWNNFFSCLSSWFPRPGECLHRSDLSSSSRFLPPSTPQTVGSTPTSGSLKSALPLSSRSPPSCLYSFSRSAHSRRV